MPNYLQRIVMSGTRTTSAAKPPLSSRALIPPVSVSTRMPMAEEGPRMAEEFSEPVLPAMRAASNEPVHAVSHKPAPHEQDISAPGVPSREEPLQAPVHNPVSDRIVPAASQVAPLPAVGVRVLAPKGLRRARAGNDRQQEITRVVEETLRAVSPRPPGNLTGVGTPVESAREVSTITPGEMSQDISSQLQRKPSAATPVPLAARIPTPRIPPPVAENNAQEVQIQAAAEAPPARILPAAQKASVEVKPSRDAEQSSTDSTVISKLPIEKQIVETRRFEERATVPKQVQPTFSTTDKRRRSQISIGRIDVQVNNLSAQAPTSPLPARQPARSNFLEARYLDRFFLKL
jgi:hypothetical protein